MEAERLEQELSEQDRVLLVFGYLGPLALVPLIASRRQFVKWHARQGLLLSLTLMAVYIILRPFKVFLNYMDWDVLHEMFRFSVATIVLGAVVVMLVCVVRGLEGERFKVPILGDLADRW